MDLLPFDLAAEDPISLVEAARLVPSRQDPRKPVGTDTILRWITIGFHPRGTARGTQIQLEGLKLGDVVVTSRESMQRFAEKCSSTTGTQRRPETVTSHEHEAATAELRAAGF